MGYERTATNFAQEEMGVRDDGSTMGGGAGRGHVGLGGHAPASQSLEDRFNSFRSRYVRVRLGCGSRSRASKALV